jgi:exodeoxyribonuclease VII large subunit
MIQKFHPRELLNLMTQKIYQSDKRLSQLSLSGRAEELIGLPEARQRVDEGILRLNHAGEIRFKGISEKLNRLEQVLGALNPSNVLGRGFSYVKNSDGVVVTSNREFQKCSDGARLEIFFHDGKGHALKD